MDNATTQNNSILYWEAMAAKAASDMAELRLEIARGGLALDYRLALIEAGELTPAQDLVLQAPVALGFWDSWSEVAPYVK